MRPGGAILSRLMMMMFPRLGLRRGNWRSQLFVHPDKVIVCPPGDRWRRLSYPLLNCAAFRAWSRKSRPGSIRTTPRVRISASSKSGSSGASAGRGQIVSGPPRIVDRVIRDDERASPARRLVRRGAVEEIRVRE